ncbi:MAG: transglycosylase SLT domain-containing protein [Flavobacteriales bacterium]|nr:transglycosylase SLT domain-containing protein [Flavobacteriales bacterium]
MKKDSAAWIGSGVFALLLALVFIRPGLPGHLLGKAEGPAWGHPLVKRDLSQIRADSLRVLVLRDPLSWEEHPGAVSGLEWELLERFAKHEKLKLKAIPVDHPDSMLLMLQQGRGDVIAAQLCPDGPARRFISFTVPYRTVAPLRAQLNTDPLVRSTIRKKGNKDAQDTLLISFWSPFFGLNTPLDSSFGHVVLRTDSSLPEDLLAQLSIGKCKAIVVPDAIGRLETQRLPQVSFNPRMGRSVPIAFGTRSNSPALTKALNAHLISPKETEALENLITSYTNGQLTKGALRTLPDLQLESDSISPFDSLFQAHADSTAYDWTLFAAVAFKESRFDSSAKSFAGAEGLMQMMPGTSEMLGVDTADGVNGHLRGATTYLADLDTSWRKSVPNKDQRLKFVLGSYNTGPGHIKDAQRLAERLGLDPKKWDGNVERALLLLSKPRFFSLPEVHNGYCRGYETFWYVRDVISAFDQFRKNDRK